MIYLERNYDCYNVIKEQYLEDPELIEKYHDKAGSGIENIVKYMLDNFKEDCANFYVLKDSENNEIVGSFANGKIIIESIPTNLICSFFIRPKYRKIVTKECWNLINSHFFNNKFIIGVVDRNVRAVKFFKQHMSKEFNSVHPETNEPISIFVFN